MPGVAFVKGLEQLTVNLKNLKPGQDKHLAAALVEAQHLLEKTVKAKAGLVDEHTLKVLADMGHPYGIGPGKKGKPRQPAPHPDEFVHIQSGTLNAAIKSSVTFTETRAILQCGVDENEVPYIRWLIYGSSVMRPRDFLGHAWLDCRDKIRKMVQYGISSMIRSRGGGP
ncbi:MAG: hypothetical protein WCO84_07255 [bacterium]